MVESLRKRDWNFDNRDDLLYAYVGSEFKNTPEDLARVADLKVKYEATAVRDMLDLKSDDVVLDLGSGYGHIARELAPTVGRYVCADISEGMLAECEANTKHLPNVARVKIERASFGALGSQRFSKAFSNSVFIHLNLFEISIYIDLLAQRLNKGGLLYFNFNDADQMAFGPDPNFSSMRARYIADPHEATLMNWNSGIAIRALAMNAGLALRKTRHWKHGSILASFERL
jgi:cyclopropane fatty-acyl-phospholipid synthase-like methyltransferase